MNNKALVLECIDFIEKNLKNDISVIDVTNKAGYSLYHFIRLFQSVTGFSPKAYILQRRLSESAKQIISTEKRINDIAYDYMFSSPQTFARAFKKHFGIKPTDIKKNSSLSAFPLLSAITKEAIHQADFIKEQVPELIELEETKFIGMTIFVKDNDDGKIIGQVWENFMKEIHTIKSRVVPEKFYQIQFWSSSAEMNGLFFMIAAEVNDISEIPPLMCAKVLPKARYLKFIHRGLSRNVGYTYKYIYNQFLLNSEYKLPYPFNFEYYCERYKGPFNEDSESEIFIPIG